MNDTLDDLTVLVLNRCWQALITRSPKAALAMMAADAATGMDFTAEGAFIPTKWDDWIKLPVREGDRSILTVRGPVRIPTVIIAVNYARVPLRRPTFGSRGIWERDGGICQYTGQKLKRGKGNIDHVVPRHRGGQSTWENCVLSSVDVNTKKAARTPEEAGLRLLRKPQAPKPVPVSVHIKNTHGIKDWDHFLIE